MTSTLAAQIAAARDTAFQDRVEAAIVLAALQIYSEAPATAGHAARAAYASAVVNSTTNKYALVFAQACAAQGLDAFSTDAQINVGVAGAWNAAAAA